MASSDSKSISGSQNIPFSRNGRDAFQDMTAFTPPPESWISRHPNQERKKDIQQQQQQQQQQPSTSKEEMKGSSLVPGANQLEKSCMNYIDSAEISIKSHKSLGTDDHFKSMVCSKNLLKVCEKLMTNKDFTKDPMSSSSSINMFDNDDDFDAELSLMNEKSRMEFYRSKYGNRRDSQSLPASPKMERKNNSANPVAYNPYFTIAKTSEAHPESSISFLTNLFGITARKPGSDTQPSSIAIMTQKTDTNHNLVEQQKNTDINLSGASEPKQPKPKMVPQPHEYREMNFWSPTSM